MQNLHLESNTVRSSKGPVSRLSFTPLHGCDGSCDNVNWTNQHFSTQSARDSVFERCDSPCLSQSHHWEGAAAFRGASRRFVLPVLGSSWRAVRGWGHSSGRTGWPALAPATACVCWTAANPSWPGCSGNSGGGHVPLTFWTADSVSDTSRRK